MINKFERYKTERRTVSTGGGRIWSWERKQTLWLEKNKQMEIQDCPR